jgi:hypothetical protein
MLRKNLLRLCGPNYRRKKECDISGNKAAITFAPELSQLLPV